MLPNRIPTGLRNTTIPNPVDLKGKRGYRNAYQGSVDGYDFLKQRQNFEDLQARLAESGEMLVEVAGVMYDGDNGYNHRFVATNKSGTIVWHKYVGYAAQSGQNHVFIHGRRIKVSVFLKLGLGERHALISGKEDFINKVFTKKRMSFLDEAGSLWC